MSGYTKECIYCHEKIRLSNDTGKWLPYGLDGTSHECRESKKPFNQPQVKQQSEQEQTQPQIKITLSLESLDQRISKLEELFGQRLQKIENLLFAIE